MNADDVLLASDWLDAAAMTQLRPEVAFSMDGKIVLVTGAAGGIGRWLALAFAAAGASVVVSDQRESAVGQVIADMSAAGARVTGITADLARASSSAELVRAVADQCGRIDVVLNCAAVNRRARALDVDTESYDRITGLNLRMPFLLSQAAARVMRETGGGAVIHITSTNARFGLESTSVYALCKAGLDQLVRTLAVEWAPLGIRVAGIAPGFMITPLSRPLWEDPVRRRWILDRVPLRRPGQPRELAGAALLLASSAGSFLTGQTIVVDGGFLAGNTWQPTDSPEDLEGDRHADQ